MTYRCGKKRYASEAQAARALERVRDWRIKAGAKEIEQRWYDCPACKGFHLTKESYRA